MPHPYFVRGAAAIKLKNNDLAISDFTEVLRMRPNFAQVYGLRGLAYHNQGDDVRAVADYDERLNREPEIGTYLNRGDARRNIDILPKQRSASGYLGIEQQLSDSLSVFARGLYADRRFEARARGDFDACTRGE